MKIKFVFFNFHIYIVFSNDKINRINPDTAIGVVPDTEMLGIRRRDSGIRLLALVWVSGV